MNSVGKRLLNSHMLSELHSSAGVSVKITDKDNFPKIAQNSGISSSKGVEPLAFGRGVLHDTPKKINLHEMQESYRIHT
jgi:hypothetical protein